MTPLKPQVKGMCPICGKPMKGMRRIYWRGAKPNALDFQYEIYHCANHGAFIWQRRKNQLVDFSKLQKEASVLPLVDEMKKRVQWGDCGYMIVKLKCPYCSEEWKQHKEFPPETWGYVLCPNGHKIPRDKAM